MLSQTPPKKAQSAAATKKGGAKPLADVENESISLDGDEPSKEVKASDKYKMVGLLFRSKEKNALTSVFT